MVKTTATITTLILIVSLVCSLILVTTLPAITHTYTALAFKPTNLKPIINNPPVANAGVNQTVNENATVVLNGIASDPDSGDNKLSYSWKQISGPGVKLNNSNTTNPSFTAPTVSSDRDLKFLLTVKMIRVLKVVMMLL